MAWEELVAQRILEPLGMVSTTAGQVKDATCSYHRDTTGKIVRTQPLSSKVTAPSGGALVSTLEDIARWAAFNLTGSRLLGRNPLKGLQRPRIPAGHDPAAPSPRAHYAMGWFVDSIGGCRRLSHAGYLNDLHTNVALYPDHGIAIIAFVNLGCARLARLVTQQAFELVSGTAGREPLEEVLARALDDYEARARESRNRNRRPNGPAPRPARPAAAYAGHYRSDGYGGLLIRQHGNRLRLVRGDLEFPLEPCGGDRWVADPGDFFSLAAPHPFERSVPLLFEAGGRDVDSLSWQLEPQVAPIRFQKDRLELSA
jgi:CubicO group peptidase (beta-lactamase class C family)